MGWFINEWYSCSMQYQWLCFSVILAFSRKNEGIAGKYKTVDDGHEAFLQFTVDSDALEVKDLWSRKFFTIVPESELVFFARKGYYPVQFTKDKDGNVTQAFIFDKDAWIKVKD